MRIIEPVEGGQLVRRRSDFVDFVVDQLSFVPELRAHAMFGGHGLYQDDRMFAIVLGDTLYLKADDASRPDFEARGLQPFTYVARGRSVTLRYYEAPPEVLEATEAARPWIEKALGAALKAGKPPPAAGAARRNAPVRKPRAPAR
jgi:DNA transformation protein